MHAFEYPKNIRQQCEWVSGVYVFILNIISIHCSHLLEWFRLLISDEHSDACCSHILYKYVPICIRYCYVSRYHDWRFRTIFMWISLQKRHFMYIKKCICLYRLSFWMFRIPFHRVFSSWLSVCFFCCWCLPPLWLCVGILYISHAVDFSPLFQLSSVNLSFDFFLILCFFVLG